MFSVFTFIDRVHDTRVRFFSAVHENKMERALSQSIRPLERFKHTSAVWIFEQAIQKYNESSVERNAPLLFLFANVERGFHVLGPIFIRIV